MKKNKYFPSPEKNFSSLLLLIIFLLFTQSITYGVIRYVSKSGSSTPPYTSWPSASDSVQKVLDICNPWDTVIIGNGVYYENLKIYTPVAIIGISMDSTVIDGTGLGTPCIAVYSDATIENLTAKGKGLIYQTSVFNVGGNITIKNCRVSDAAVGIQTASDIAEVKNCIIKNTYYGIISGWSSASQYHFNNNLIYLVNEAAVGVYLEWGRYYINNNIIIYNDMYSNPDAGILVVYANKTYIRNNLISRFSRNIAFVSPSDTTFIINNVITYKNDVNSTYAIWAGSRKVVIRNNIFSNNPQTAVRGLPPNVTSNYNLFWNNENNIYGIPHGEGDIVDKDPMFIKDTVPLLNNIYDFHLQKHSPAIDKGDPSILDVDGTRSDIGMYGGPLGERYTYQNPAPRAPVNLLAFVDSVKITLTWNKNTEADTAYYNVYRDTTVNFIIDSTKLIASVTIPLFTEPLLSAGRYVYKITCVDNEGNESDPSLEKVINITSIKEFPTVIDEYALYQNYPNPFNPNTSIAYRLKERADVKLMVYDIKGELVSVLLNKQQEQGYYEVNFDAGELSSGIYLYRIEVIGEGRIPVYSDMKKMVYIK